MGWGVSALYIVDVVWQAPHPASAAAQSLRSRCQQQHPPQRILCGTFRDHGAQCRTTKTFLSARGRCFFRHRCGALLADVRCKMNWPERCSAAFERSRSEVGQLTLIISCVGGVLVRSGALEAFPNLTPLLPSPLLQIAAFLATAAIAVCLFWRWFRLDSSSRAVVWRLYGRFTAMVFFGCIFAAMSCTSPLASHSLHL